MPEYPRSPFEKTGTSITPNVDGDALNATTIGETTPAAGSFTTLTASTDPTDADGIGDTGFYDNRYALESNNLSDLDSVSIAFGNIKQASTESVTGVIEKATTEEVVAGTDTDRAVTPAGITARMEDPGEIGGLTPAAGNFTTLYASGQLQGDLINNHMVSKVIFDILGLMVDPRFLNLHCEDPGAGTMVDVSGQGHDGTYQGSMATGDRIMKGMGWSVDFDGTDDYIDLGNHNDFSFGDGTNDEDVTFFGVFEILDTGINQAFLSKYDSTDSSEFREWRIILGGDLKLTYLQHDESANVSAKRITDASISVGFHTIAITSPGDGGATAMDNVKIYIDGVLVASTATNNASYVAMENLANDCYIGTQILSTGIPINCMTGDISLIGIDGYEWTAMDIRRFHQLCKGLYGI